MVPARSRNRATPDPLASQLLTVGRLEEGAGRARTGDLLHAISKRLLQSAAVCGKKIFRFFRRLVCCRLLRSAASILLPQRSISVCEVVISWLVCISATLGIDVCMIRERLCVSVLVGLVVLIASLSSERVAAATESVQLVSAKVILARTKGSHLVLPPKRTKANKSYGVAVVFQTSKPLIRSHQGSIRGSVAIGKRVSGISSTPRSNKRCYESYILSKRFFHVGHRYKVKFSFSTSTGGRRTFRRTLTLRPLKSPKKDYSC